MMYYVRLSKTIHRQLRNLPGNIRSVANQKILALAQTPYLPDAKELEEHPSYFPIWLNADFRLVWQVIEEEQVVDVLYVGPKLPDLYERLGLGRST